MDKKRINLPLISTVLAAIIIIITLFVPPFVGVADDGSIFSTLSASGLYNIYTPSTEYISLTYGIENNSFSFQNTLVFIISIIKTFCGDVFDVRIMGAIFAVLLLIALYKTVSLGATYNNFIDFILAAGAVLIFADVAYISYLTSLHREGITFAFGLLTLASLYYVAKKEEPKIWGIILFFVSGVGFALISSSYWAFAVIFAIISVRLVFALKPYMQKILSGIFAVVFALCAVFSGNLTPESERRNNLYNSVFYGILMAEDDAQKALSSLGLSEKLAPLAKTTVYDKLPEDINLEEEFYSKISYVKIAVYYLKNPVAYIKNLNVAANNATQLQMKYLSNFESGSGKKTASFISLYSSLKSKVIPNMLVTILLIMLAYLGGCIKERLSESEKKTKKLWEFYISVFLMALSAIKMPVIYSGIANIGKNMFVFQMFFDVMVLIILVAGSGILVKRRKNLVDKYGVNQ